MKKFLYVIVLTCMPTYAMAENTKHIIMPENNEIIRTYDKSGKSTGKIERRGNTIRFYDNTGKSTQKSEIRENSIRHYSPNGKFLGEDKK